MRKFLVLLVGLMVLLSTEVTAGDFKEIPLPGNIQISAAPDGLPADEAVFLGAWEGKWDRLPVVVIITRITTGGKVSGYYGWGKGRSFEAGSDKITGKIGLGKRDNKVLRFKYLSAKISFRVPKNGIGLKGKYKIDGRTTEGEFAKTDL